VSDHTGIELDCGKSEKNRKERSFLLTEHFSEVKMQIEIPSFVKTHSVKSLFDVVMHNSHTKRFSFGSTSSKLVSIPVAKEEPQQQQPEPTGRVLTPQEEQCEIINKMANYIDKFLVTEDNPSDKSCFLGTAVPPINLVDYIERLVKYINQWAEDIAGPNSPGIRCMLLAVEYLERSRVKITPRSVHRYLMSAVLIAVKFTEDFAISNKFWGDVGGCKLEDVNRMEMAFCQILSWNFSVSTDEFVIQQARFGTPAF
jgi:hypothetical protein